MKLRDWMVREGLQSSLLLCYSLLCPRALYDETTALWVGLSTLVPKCTFCAQLPEGSSVMQTMENPLFSLKSTFDIWVNSSFTAWAVITIITFLWLWYWGSFFLTLPYLKNNSFFPPPRKHGNIRKVRNTWSRPRSTYFSLLFYYYFHFSESTNKTLETEKNRTSILKKERMNIHLGTNQAEQGYSEH